MRITAAFFVLALAAAPTSLWAGNPSSNDKSVGGEFAGFAGGVFGVGPPHETAGGGVGITLRRWALLFEYAHIPMGSEYFGAPGVHAPFQEPAKISNSRANEYSLVGHVSLPIGIKKIVPYTAGGIGWITSSFTSSGIVRVLPPGSEPIRYMDDVDSSGFSFNLGGGLRMYLSDRWGLRPEVKFFRRTREHFETRANFVRASIGIFFQTRRQNRTK